MNRTQLLYLNLNIKNGIIFGKEQYKFQGKAQKKKGQAIKPDIM